MTRPSRLLERRGPGRPVVGDTASCSRCAEGLLEFTERYRIFRGAEGRLERVPAWVCGACPHVVFVRSAHQPGAARAAAREPDATATRPAPKPRALRNSSGRAVHRKVGRAKGSKAHRH